MSSKCKECSLLFSTRAAMRHHFSTKHVDVCVLQCGSESVTLTRVNGVFTCTCGRTTTSSKKLHEHVKCYIDKQLPTTEAIEDERRITVDDAEHQNDSSTENEDHTSAPTVSTEGNPEHDGKIAVSMLNKYNLVYHDKYKLLVCPTCNQVLGKCFYIHTKNEHGLSIPAVDQEAIRRTCLSEVSAYAMGSRSLLPPLDFVEIWDGYGCSSCCHYGIEERHVKDHARKKHGNDLTFQCKVQTISTTCCKKYIGVHDRNPSPEAHASSDASSQVRNTSDLAMQMMSSVFNPQLPPEPFRQRNVFYLLTGWYPEPEFQDRYNSVDKRALLEVPQESDQENGTKTRLMCVFRDAIKGVTSVDYLCRLAVNCGAYSCAFAQLIFFVSNLSKAELPNLPISEAVKELITNVMEEPANERSVFKLLHHLVTEKTTSNSDNTTALIPLYVRFCCSLPNGSLMAAEDVSRLCAKMIYLIKLTVLRLIVEKEASEKEKALIDLKELIKVDNHFSVFAFMCRMKGLAAKVALSSNKLPAVAKASSDFDVVVRGMRINDQQLRDVYKQVYSKCESLLNELLLGMSFVPDFDAINDNFSNNTPGYQFMADKDVFKNKKVRSSLLTYILKSEFLERRFVKKTVNGERLYHPTEANKYLETYDEYVKNLLLLIHIGSGMPARATELETYRICNGRSMSRNVFILCRQIFLFSEYSKSRSVTGLNRGVCRFLDQESSVLLTTDLLVVRPIVCLFADFMGRNEGSVYNFDLFVIGGAKIQGPAIRNTFASLFMKYSGSALSFSDYRQLVKYYGTRLRIAKYKNLDMDSDEEQETTNVNDEQFAHSSRTANVYYGRHGEELPRLREHIVQEFRELSDNWHRFLKGSQKRSHEEVEAVEAPSTSVTGHLKTTDSSRLQISQVRVAGPFSTSFVTPEQSRFSLECLREFYKDSNAVFKSEQQRAAVDNILHTLADVIAILPTGCGKSLLFFLHCHANRHKTNVVIVPTVSLQEDLSRRAEAHGISCATVINSVTTTQTSLLLLTPEAVAGTTSREGLISLHSTKQLGRFFIDEAHMFSTESDYRPTFRQLALLTFLPHVPVVLMTATCPEWILQDLQSKLLGREALVIRQPTNRLNICYSIVQERIEYLLIQCANNLQRYNPDERSIVYATSLDLVCILKQKFDEACIPTSIYSGQQEDEVNQSSFLSWREGKSPVMIATSAFGLGVDYPHVRHVFCFGLPYSIEDFSQQTGRAGRDDKTSCAVVIFDERKELYKLSHMPNGPRKKAFESMVLFANDKSPICRRRVLSRYLDGAEIECSYVNCECCDVCQRCTKDAGIEKGTTLPEVQTQETDYTGIDFDMAQFLEPDSHEVVLDISFGQGVLSSERSLGQELLRFLNKYKVECIICYVAKGATLRHDVHHCPSVFKLCLRCFCSGHWVKNCPVTESRTIVGTCPRCFLPLQIGDVVFHPHGFAKHCISEDLKLFGLAYAKFRKVCDGEWLYARDSKGMLNLWTTFVNYCQGNI